MKLRHRIALTLALAVAGAVPLMGASSALIPDGTRYSVEASLKPELVIVRAEGDTREKIVVPGTEDEAIESQAQLAYDSATGALYVVWSRDAIGLNDIRVAALGVDGTWTTPLIVASGGGQRHGLQLVLTHAVEEGQSATLLNVAWWKLAGDDVDPEYAMVGFEDGETVAQTVANLRDIADLSGDAKTAAHENTGEVTHPPLAMARSGEGVDVVFGDVDTTTLTRVNIDPRKIAGNVRAWIPVGRRGHRTPRANIVSPDGKPVQAFISPNGRVVLYAPGRRFIFVMLDDDGKWSPTRSLRVDDKMTAEHVLNDLRRTVEELETLAVPEAER